MVLVLITLKMQVFLKRRRIKQNILESILFKKKYSNFIVVFYIEALGV